MPVVFVEFTLNKVMAILPLPAPLRGKATGKATGWRRNVGNGVGVGFLIGGSQAASLRNKHQQLQSIACCALLFRRVQIPVPRPRLRPVL